MNLKLSEPKGAIVGKITVPGSKSESNRLLILQALFPEIKITNLSNSDDTRALQGALSSKEETVDIHHAGTAMRFLTAYFAAKENRKVVLTGSERMQQRPVGILVNALRELGADISYQKEEGYPPLVIQGKRLEKNTVSLNANVSSQYISALMLIAPSLPKGLEITLEGTVTSVPYILMTLSLLQKAGIKGNLTGNKIRIEPKAAVDPVSFTVESDWSSASYFYSIAALSSNAEIILSSYKKSSHQGDAVVADIYERLGVLTVFAGEKISLLKTGSDLPESLELDLSDSPDLAQTVAVTCFGLGIYCELTGLHTLKIKETDRLQALQNEIERMGGRTEITEASIKVFPVESFRSNEKIPTYNDHRMAMAFAPMALKVPLEIEDAGVVTKSFRGFWEELEKLGINCTEI